MRSAQPAQPPAHPSEPPRRTAIRTATGGRRVPAMSLCPRIFSTATDASPNPYIYALAMTVHGQEFHQQLRAIEAQVIELFGLVADDVPRATDALLSGNSEEVQRLAERDRAIDDLYPRIEELADR